MKQCDWTYYQFNADKLSDTCKALMAKFNANLKYIQMYDLFGKCYYTNLTSNTPTLIDGKQVLEDDGLQTEK